METNREINRIHWLVSLLGFKQLGLLREMDLDGEVNTVISSADGVNRFIPL